MWFGKVFLKGLFERRFEVGFDWRFKGSFDGASEGGFEGRFRRRVSKGGAEGRYKGLKRVLNVLRTVWDGFEGEGEKVLEEGLKSFGLVRKEP